MTAKVVDVGPLDWRVSIVDKSGRPSPEFQRRWNTNRNNSALIGTITFGDTAPPEDPVPKDGAEFINTSVTPAVLYIAQNGTWLQVGPVVFTDLQDVPHGYSGFGMELVRVRGDEHGLEFVALDSLTANPTAVASDTAVPGTLSTFMRSDAAPAVQLATTTDFGLVKPDGTTVTIAGGVITAVGGGGGGGGVSFGTGAPSTLIADGDIYFDQTSVPYQGYVQAPITVGGGIPTILNTNVGGFGGTGGTHTVTTTTAGSTCLVVIVTWEKSGSAFTVSSVTSTSGLTYTQYLVTTDNSGTTGLAIYTAPLTTVLTSEVVTVTMSGGIDDGTIATFDVANADSTIFDNDPSLPGTDSFSAHNPMSVTAATTNSNCLVCYVPSTNFNGSGTTPTPFTTVEYTYVNNGGALWSSTQLCTFQAPSPLASATYTSPITSGAATMAIFAFRGTPSHTTSSWVKFG